MKHQQKWSESDFLCSPTCATFATLKYIRHLTVTFFSVPPPSLKPIKFVLSKGSIMLFHTGYPSNPFATLYILSKTKFQAPSRFKWKKKFYTQNIIQFITFTTEQNGRLKRTLWLSIHCLMRNMLCVTFTSQKIIVHSSAKMFGSQYGIIIM